MKNIEVFTDYPLYGFNTLNGDVFSLMFYFKNIYAGLISDFRRGKIEPMIAESWDISKDGREWKFKIRKGLKFTDGEDITPEEVYKSFRRIFWLTRNNKTRLHKSLVGLEKWDNYEKGFEGIRLEGDELVFRFNERPYNVFESLSQAMYGVVSSKCYDEDGKWKDDKYYIGSGQYEIVENSGERIILRDRHMYPEVDDAPDIVDIYVTSDILSGIYEKNPDFCLILSDLMSQSEKGKIIKNSYEVLARPPVNMRFLELNWRKPPFNDKKLRQYVRDEFINRMIKEIKEYKFDFSFIPKGGVGYVKFNSEKPKKNIKYSEVVEILTIKRDPKSVTFKAERLLEKILNQIGIKTCLNILTTKEFMNLRQKKEFDALFFMSGILVNDPWADLRLMFMSDIGAMIPDPSGKIPSLIEEAEKENNPIKRKKIAEEINRIIYDESAVITFLHLSVDYVHRKNLDFSSVNLFSDPVEFRCISVKK